MDCETFQDSAPYRSTSRTLLLKILNLVSNFWKNKFYFQHFIHFKRFGGKGGGAPPPPPTPAPSLATVLWIQTLAFTKAKGLRAVQSLISMCARTSSLLRHFNTGTPPVPPTGSQKDLVKGEALRLLRTNSSKKNI